MDALIPFTTSGSLVDLVDSTCIFVPLIPLLAVPLTQHV
jgi:hypothetical protein